MKQIRRSVFETNSSSTHSVTILHNGLEKNDMRVHEDGYIHTEIGEFGWEIADYKAQEDRLSYLVTMLAEKNGMYRWWSNKKSAKENVKELMSVPEFKRISKEIGKHAGCKGIIIDPSNGYIDHQSHDTYSTLQDFLDDYGTDVVEFVFGRGTVVHTDNDNH